jgi:hypothetical protein
MMFEGRVEEIDWGRWTFTLREVRMPTEAKAPSEVPVSEIFCRADNTIVDELRELYGDNPHTRIIVYGTYTQSYLQVDRYEVVNLAVGQTS